jgi:hypothetical protein
MQMTPPHTLNTAWQDRWTHPTVKQVLAALNAQHRRCAERFVDQVTQLPGVTQSMIWYGPSWRWTVQFMLASNKDPRGEPLCYLVPGDDRPTAHVPLTEDFVAVLPLRRLSKFVRDGVKAAKRAVEISWANWPLDSDTDAKLVLDLVTRKHKFVNTPKVSADTTSRN